MQFDAPLAGHLVLDGELSPGSEPLPVVHGLLHDGGSITALQCYAAGRRTHGTGDERHTRQTLAVMTFVIGEYLDAEPVFDRIAVHLNYLREWADVREGWESPAGDASGYSLRYTRPRDRSVSLRDGRAVALRTVQRIVSSSRSVAAEQETIFSVVFRTPATLDTVGNTVASLRDLISFTRRRPTSVLRITTTCPGVLIAPGVDVPRELDLRSTQVTQESATADAASLPEWDFLFLAPEAPAEYGALIQSWFDLEERLDVMLDLFLGLLYAPPRHLENKVMNICQAAEGYHRRTLDHTLMPADQYKALTDTLIGACPEDRREGVRDLLSHGNAPSFRQRIEELVVRAGGVSDTLTRTFANFSGKLRNYRVLYAHGLAGNLMNDDAVAELADLYDTMRIILEVCLLQDLGWSSPEADRAMAEKRDYVRLSKRARV